MKPFAIALWVLAFHHLAPACTCGDPPPCTKVGPNAVVFVGVALNEAYTSTRDLSRPQPVRFRVEKSFKGLPDGTQFVEIDTAAGSSCQAPFSRGKRYVVYAESDPSAPPASGSLTMLFRRVFYGETAYPRRLFTSLCKGSRQIEKAAEDLRFLEAFRAHQTVTSIQGQVYADTGQGNYRLYDRLQKLLPGTSVTVSTVDGHQYTAAVDSTGRFLIEPVRPGSYTLRASQPKFRSGQSEYEISVPEGGCGAIYVAMGFDGTVSGRLREPRGRPPVPIKVQLIPVLGGDAYPEPLETTTAADGTYTFTRVPVGRYVLGVNVRDEPTKKIPYKRVYFPGVEDRERARILNLGEADKISNANFRMSERLNPRVITAEISWADGTPARYVHTWCAPTGYVPWQHLLTDSEGRIAFPAMDGLAYDIGAAAASDYEITSKRRISAKPIHVPPGPSTAARLVLSIAPK